MGMMDAFEREDRVQIKYSDLFRMMKAAAKAEIIQEIVLAENNCLKAGTMIKKLVEYKQMEEG
ncbi:MAG: hypothetical protein IKE52_02510 [Mogibacterium sp.]|nr:hypothetical protein [Mogibacterium sp.]